jgi:hypothetical protein
LQLRPVQRGTAHTHVLVCLQNGQAVLLGIPADRIRLTAL